MMLLLRLVVAVQLACTEAVLSRLPFCSNNYESGTVCYPESGVGMCTDLKRDGQKFTNFDAYEHCEAMCRGEGMIPFQMGVIEVGVNKDFMDKLCLSHGLADDEIPIMKPDKKLIIDCQARGQSFDRLNYQAGDFINAFEQIKLEQVRYGEEALHGISAVNDHIQHAIDNKVKEARPSEKIQVLAESVDDAIKDHMPSKAKRQKVKDSIAHMVSKGFDLIENLDVYLEDMQQFKDECVVLTSVEAGRMHAKMLSLCATNANFCLTDDDDEQIEHIGCCCGGVPAIMTNLTAPGGGMQNDCLAEPVKPSEPRRMEEGDRKLEQRRLESTSDSTKSACAFAREAAIEGAKALKQDLHADGFSTENADRLIDQHKVECNGRRLQTTLGEENSSATPRRLGPCFSAPSEPALSDWPYADTTVMQVTEQQFDGYCSELGQDGMKEMCNSFCGSDGGVIPFLIGTGHYGFSHEESDEICLKFSGDVVNPNKVDSCMHKAKTMEDHHQKVTQLVVGLEKVNLAKLLVQGRTADAAASVKDWTMTEAADEFKSMDRGESAKVLDLYRARISSLQDRGNIQARELTDAVEEVKEAAAALNASLRRLGEEAMEFIDECNTLVTGRDARGFYKMDICATHGEKCFDKHLSTHAVCCCGFMPLTQFGQQVDLTQTIPGVSGLDGRRLDGRRLDGGFRALPSVCQTAKEWLVEDRAHVFTELESLHQTELFFKYDEEVYGGTCEATTTTTTPEKGPTPSTTQSVTQSTTLETTSPSSTSAVDRSGPEELEKNSNRIFGFVVMGVVVLLIGCCVLCCCWRKRGQVPSNQIWSNGDNATKPAVIPQHTQSV